MSHLTMALTELHRSEIGLARLLRAVAARHRVEHEIHHVALDLAHWSDDHIEQLSDAGAEYGLTLKRPSSTVDLAHTVTDSVQQRLSEALGRRPEPALLLLVDLRHLYRTTAGVSLDWELLAQGTQAMKNTHLLDLAEGCHPESLRQMQWANAMVKTLSPQVLAT
ncbi:hypothetical protein [Williamsia limnetica]|nr:hypothetical protein [Williamsia limnetica]